MKGEFLIYRYNNHKMEITWHGGTTFTIKGKKTTLEFDSIEGGNHLLKSTKADTVLLTDNYDEKAKLVGGAEESDVISWPGEYEYKGAAIVAIPAFTNEKKEGDSATGRILIYSLLIDDIRIGHLAEIGQELDEDIIGKIGDIDILMVSAASEKGLPMKKLHQAVEEIDPRILIPMNFKTEAELEPLLKEMGVTEHEVKDSLEIKLKTDMPEDITDFVVLKAS